MTVKTFNSQPIKQSNFIRKASKGFTLIELLVVIVIVGILGAIINNIVGGSGVAASAKAEQKYEAALKVVNTWAAVAQYMNVSKHPLDSNLFANGLHDALDVLIPLDPTPAIANEFSARYAASAPVRSLEQFQVVTPPTSTSRGVYAIGDAKNIVTIAYNAATQNMSVRIAAVPAEEVRALMDKYHPATGGVSTNYTTISRTTSNIQYDSINVATQTHNLTIIRKI